MHQLERYKAIAWDFDGTLIEHPKSPLMHEYIIAHPEKTHAIITFRSHGWQRRVWDEMYDLYPDAPERDCFAGVYNVSDRAFERYDETKRLRALGRYRGPMTPWERYYIQWKGLVCKLRDLPVLVDDREDEVLPGCEKYGIHYVHPDDL